MQFVGDHKKRGPEDWFCETRGLSYVQFPRNTWEQHRIDKQLARKRKRQAEEDE